RSLPIYLPYHFYFRNVNQVRSKSFYGISNLEMIRSLRTCDFLNMLLCKYNNRLFFSYNLHAVLAKVNTIKMVPAILQAGTCILNMRISFLLISKPAGEHGRYFSTGMHVEF